IGGPGLVCDSPDDCLSVFQLQNSGSILVRDDLAGFNDRFQDIFGSKPGSKLRKIRAGRTTFSLHGMTTAATGGQEHSFPLLKIPSAKSVLYQWQRFFNGPSPSRTFGSLYLNDIVSVTGQQGITRY